MPFVNHGKYFRFTVFFMRLWSIHPEYLDAKGLVALWRESLLAQKVLLGKTRGYKNHPQLLRFRNIDNSLGAIASYLRGVEREARKRGYNFDASKIIDHKLKKKISVNKGQLEYEFLHLLSKLKARDPELYHKLKSLKSIKTHSIFITKKGGVEAWEVQS